MSQGLIDGIGRASGEASRANSLAHQTLVQMACHLRWDHGMSRRATAKRLDVKERWVKKHVDDLREEP